MDLMIFVIALDSVRDLCISESIKFKVIAICPIIWKLKLRTNLYGELCDE